MHRSVLVSLSLALLAALSVVPETALAGPPLICHTFDIGDANSLPWSGGGDWNSPNAAYDVGRLVRDTLALLSPEAPVVLRMETLRRATIYGAKDRAIAYELLAQLMARALRAEAAGKSEALAWFDAGYLVESYKQASFIHNDMLGPDKRASWVHRGNRVEGLNGYVWVVKALRLGGDAVAIEFAASLMLDSQFPNEHFRKAVAGASEGSLVARNLLQFGDRARTIAELRAKYK